MENENPTTKPSQELQLLACLPDEIIVEILLRLPVKALLKFKCVSKSWLSLLSSPRFINTQINFSTKDRKNVNLRLAVIASVSGLGKICSVYSLFNFAKLDYYPLKAPLGSAKIIGSCNGLICLTAVSFKVMLWNPSTGKYKEFPDSFVHSGVSCYIRYGFGYDSVNDDYKVVKIFSFAKNEGKYENIVKIYSVRTNSWMLIRGFDSDYINGVLGVFVNGSLHWEVGDSSGSREIMTLDLVSETYGKMELPSCGNGDLDWALSVLGGCLVACCNYYPDKTDVWVMKEYGVHSSWTKLLSNLSPVNRRGYISPLFLSENGDQVIGKLGTDICLYNSRSCSYESMKIHVSGVCLQVQAVAYTESLASPR